MTEHPAPAPPQALVVRLGTRGSRLALAQSAGVARDLETASAARGVPVHVELVRLPTRGDVDRTPLRLQGGTGVFVARLREALLAGRCDLAVHSFKDLPVEPAPGLDIVAVPRRGDPRDVLCARDGLALAALPPFPRIGTGSVRRAAQVVHLRPDARIVDVRGNVPTRLARVGQDLDAVVLAAAGLDRLGLASAVTEFFDPDRMMPAASQGALAVELPADAAPPLTAAVRALDHRPSHLAALAERALMRSLGAGCAAPVGALATLAHGTLDLEAAVIPVDAAPLLRRSRSLPLDEDDPSSGRAAGRLGADLGRDLLEAGAADLADLAARSVDRLPGEARP